MIVKHLNGTYNYAAFRNIVLRSIECVLPEICQFQHRKDLFCENYKTNRGCFQHLFSYLASIVFSNSRRSNYAHFSFIYPEYIT